MTPMSDPLASAHASAPGPSRLKRSADVLWSAAKDVHTAVTADDTVAIDVREAIDAINRALGELGTAADVLERRFAHSELRSRELELRAQEFIASLLGARRNGELVCRHLPKTPPRRACPPVVCER